MSARGFSLIELLVVTLILVAIVGAAGLNLADVSASGRRRAAVETVASVYRLAWVNALATGTAHQLVCRASGCRIGKPLLVDGEWRWSRSEAFAIPRGVRIDGVTRVDGGRSAGVSAPPWVVTVDPVVRPQHLVLRLRAPGSSDVYKVRVAFRNGVVDVDEIDRLRQGQRL